MRTGLPGRSIRTWFDPGHLRLPRTEIGSEPSPTSKSSADVSCSVALMTARMTPITRFRCTCTCVHRLPDCVDHVDRAAADHGPRWADRRAGPPLRDISHRSGRIYPGRAAAFRVEVGALSGDATAWAGVPTPGQTGRMWFFVWDGAKLGDAVVVDDDLPVTAKDPRRIAAQIAAGRDACTP